MLHSRFLQGENPNMASNPTPTGTTSSIFERVKNILLHPKEEWVRIDAEPATVVGLFTTYAMILAAIGPIASVIGMALLGMPIGFALPMAVVSYVVSLCVVFLTSLIIDALAPSFGGTKNQVQATKVAVYSATPGWVIGIVSIIPQLFALTAVLALIAGLYGIYLIYLGLPRLMRVAQDKAVVYVVVVVVAWILIYWIFMMVLAGLILSTIGIGAMAGGYPRY
jgi:hypothetical protein